MSYTLFDHQKDTVEFMERQPRTFINSDPGTGKTLCCIEAYKRRKNRKRMLVLAPLSILKAAWADDFEKFYPEAKVVCAYAKNRAQAFASDADVVVANHDAVKWILKQFKADKDFLSSFDELVIDEFTAFKNRSSERSKALASIRHLFEYRRLLSGTPNSNTILDLWHPAFVCDDGERLGQNFFQFRNSVCSPKPSGFNSMITLWEDNEGAEEQVGLLLKDITIRYKIQDCIDMPENSVNTVLTELPPKLMKVYDELKKESVAELESGQVINAVHAGSRAKKLLQVCTGAIYDEEKLSHVLDLERYQLVIDLIEQREQCVVAFNWKHERDQLIALADKAGMSFAVIDGDTPVVRRHEYVDLFQAGELKVIFAHPQSAGHGLTLTKGTTTIWASPTYNAEHYTQFNARIYRAGQKRKTETLHIAARGTWEETVYDKLQGKLEKMDTLQSFFELMTKAA